MEELLKALKDVYEKARTQLNDWLEKTEECKKKIAATDNLAAKLGEKEKDLAEREAKIKEVESRTNRLAILETAEQDFRDTRDSFLAVNERAKADLQKREEEIAKRENQVEVNARAMCDREQALSQKEADVIQRASTVSRLYDELAAEKRALENAGK